MCESKGSELLSNLRSEKRRKSYQVFFERTHEAVVAPLILDFFFCLTEHREAVQNDTENDVLQEHVYDYELDLIKRPTDEVLPAIFRGVGLPQEHVSYSSR